MTDFVAILKMGADTSGLLKGKRALEDTTKAGGAAEKAVGGTEQGFIRAGRGAGQATPRLDGFNKAADRSRALAMGAAKAVAGMAASYATFQAASAAITMARDFNAALAETSTLIEGTPEQMDAITAAARGMAREFGGNATQNVKAFYQALSAGADGVEGATKLLDQANKLAIGGVTDVTTGVDALTTAMNAYGPEVLSAADASDAMFVAMRAGKTTIGELSGSLGQIVPIASSAGVSFDEVTAGIAALTTQGLSTASATTGLRQVLAGIIAPTKQATDAAKALGIEFDVQALKSKGLAGFLEEVIQKTGGNEAAMAQLFGSVEALGAALAFAGGAGGTFTNILADMETKAGATDAAYQKMANSLDQRWSRITAAARDIALGLGNALLAVVVPAMEGIAAISVTVGQNLDTVVVAMSALAATQIPAAVAGFTALTAGMSASAVATGVFTAAVNVARGAIIALGGPLGLIYGILGASAAAWLLWDKGAADGEQASYDAAAGTSALLGTLDEFYQTAAPASGSAAIALANDNYKLAASAFEAAKAELALLQAMNATAEQRLADNNAAMPFGTNLGKVQETEATKRLAAAERDLNQAIRDRKVAVTAVTGSMSETMTNTVLANNVTKDFTVTVDTNTDALGGGAKAAKGAAKEIKDLADEIERLEFDADPLKKYNAEIANLDTLVAAGLSDGAYAKAVADLNDEFANSNPTISKAGDAIASFVASGLSDFKSLLSAFKSMLAEMIATAIANPIKLALMGSFSGAGGAMAGVPGGGAMGGGIFGGGGGILGNIGGAIGGVASAFGTGFMSSAGGFLSGGLSGGFGAIGAQLSATAAGGFGLSSVAASIGAIAAPLLAVGAVFSFFRTKTTELDRGLRVTVDGMDALVESFRTVEKKKFWGLSKKVRTSASPLDEAEAEPIRAAINQMQTGAIAAADALGIASSAFDGFSTSLDISLKGLSESEAQQAVEDGLNGITDAMAEMIPGLDAFRYGSETAGETLNRLSSSLEAANYAFGNLGATLFEGSLSGANLASSFVQLFGSIDQFVGSMDYYFANFYSNTEIAAASAANLQEQFAAMNLVMPQSAAEFRKLVDAAIAAGSAGASMAQKLISLAPAFVQNQNLQAAAIADPYKVAADEAIKAAKAQAAAQVSAAREATRAAKEQLAAERERRKSAIEQERYSLETRYLQAIGDVNTLREREIAALDSANQAFGRMVIELEAAQKAAEALSESDFASRVDYSLARARALNSGVQSGGNVVPFAPPSMPMPAPSSGGTTSGSTAGLTATEQRELLRLLTLIERNTKDTSRNTEDLVEMQDEGGVLSA